MFYSGMHALQLPSKHSMRDFVHYLVQGFDKLAKCNQKSVFFILIWHLGLWKLKKKTPYKLTLGVLQELLWEIPLDS